MATDTQVISRILSLLRAVGTGQSPSTEDSAVVREYIPFKLEELAQRGVFYISDIESVPDNAVFWFATCVAQDLAEDFGKTADPSKTAMAEAMLRQMKPQPEFQILEATTF